MTNYLESAIAQFEYYKSLGDKSLAQLSEKELFWSNTTDDNSMAIIVNHLAGNMLSRWTDIFNTDGEKEWRKRDQEFEAVLKTEKEVYDQWEKGWTCLFSTLKALSPEDLEKIIYIRNQGHTVIEAINRQLCHYAYHVGQMVYLAKQIKGGEWNSLSIPKGKSQDYNKDKFSQEKRKEHFTNEYLKK